MLSRKAGILGVGLLTAILIVVLLPASNTVVPSQPVLSDAFSSPPEYGEKRYGLDHFTTRPKGPIEIIGRPNQSGWADDVGVPPYQVRTNAQGIREEQLSPYPSQNTTRVLVIGDSFTFGVGVNESERFTEVADGLLGAEYQLVNAGFPGWGAKDYYLFLWERGLEYRPDIVVIAFLLNDFFSVNESRSIQQQAKKLLNQQENVSRLTESEKSQHIRDIVWDMKEPVLRQVTRNKTRFMRSSLLTSVNRTVGLSRDSGTCIMFYPIGPLGYIASWAEQRNIPVSLPPQRWPQLRRQGELRVSALDSHPDPHGHRILGRGLAEFIAEDSPNCTAHS